MMGLAAQKKYFRVAAAKNYDDVFKDLPSKRGPTSARR